MASAGEEIYSSIGLTHRIGGAVGGWQLTVGVSRLSFIFILFLYFR